MGVYHCCFLSADNNYVSHVSERIPLAEQKGCLALEVLGGSLESASLSWNDGDVPACWDIGACDGLWLIIHYWPQPDRQEKSSTPFARIVNT